MRTEGKASIEASKRSEYLRSQLAPRITRWLLGTYPASI